MWLQDGRAERFMYGLGLGMDMVLEKLVQSVKQRRPTTCDPSALHLHGLDRDIPQGLTEDDDDYRTRLQRSNQTWRDLAGSAWGVLSQTLTILLADYTPAIRMVANRYDKSTPTPTVADSKWDGYVAGGDTSYPPHHTAVASENWNWDHSSHVHGTFCWSRFWLVLESVAPNDWVHRSTDKWNEPGLKWDDTGHAWDVDVTADLGQRIWDQILKWKSANAEVACLIVSFDSAQFDPDEPEGGGINPDGTFGRWGKFDVNGVYVPARIGIDAVYSHRVQEGSNA